MTSTTDVRTPACAAPTSAELSSFRRGNFVNWLFAPLVGRLNPVSSRSLLAGYTGFFAVVLFFSAMGVLGGAEGPKTFAEFEQSAKEGAKLPGALSQALSSLWFFKAGQWERAHELAQDIKTETGSWIHGFLHRDEGDLANAGYWYRRAGMTRPEGLEIAEEWQQIAKELWHREKGVIAGKEILTSSSGLVAASVEASAPEEGAWDTVISKNRKTLGRIENARPVSFSPSGDVLLLVDAAPNNDLKHFLIKPINNLKVPAFGKRVSIGSRFIAKHEWSKDGASITLIPDPKLSDAKPETISVMEHLTSK